MTAPPPSPTEPVSPDSLGRRVLVNTGALSGSSLWRIGTSFLLQLLIARILGVEALGIYTVALAYLNVGQVASELGLPALLARDLAPMPHKRSAYFRRTLLAQVVASLLVWAGLILLAFVLPYEPVARAAVILVGASLPLYAITSASETLFRASERMELVMAVEVFINLLILALSAILLFRGDSVLALIGVLVVTQAVSALTCLLIIRRSHLLAPPQEPADVAWLALWQTAAPFFGLSIAEVLQQRMDVLLLSIVAGPAVTGIYSAAYNLVRVLVKLVQSFWQALYPTLSRLHYESNAHYQTLSGLSLRFGLLVLLPCAALTAGISGDLIDLIYTDDYAASAPVLRLLIWIAPILFVESYAVTQLAIQRHALHALAVTASNVMALLVILPLLATLNGAVGAAWASVFAATFGGAAGIFALRRYAIPIALAGIVWMAVATLVAGLLASLLPAHWLVRISVAAAAYLAIVWLSGLVTPADTALFRRALRPNTQ